jgi:NitT/TauT family transport system substrate-binding protein
MKPTHLFKAFALALLLAAAPAQAQKIKVGYWTSGFSLGFGAVMEQMKIAEKEGIEVEWVKFAEVNGPTRAIVPQTIDLAFGAPSTASMTIAADGVPIKIVLASQIAEAQIVVPAGSPIKSIADLKGKKIGMSPPGSATHAIATSNKNTGARVGLYAPSFARPEFCPRSARAGEHAGWLIAGEQARQGKMGTCRKPVVSSRPNIRFMHCTP